MNFDLLLIIIGMASLMNLLHKAPIYHRFLQALLLDIKPFNCVMCSTFWATLPVSLITYPIWAIFISSIAAIAAELINIQIHKI